MIKLSMRPYGDPDNDMPPHGLRLKNDGEIKRWIDRRYVMPRGIAALVYRHDKMRIVGQER